MTIAIEADSSRDRRSRGQRISVPRGLGFALALVTVVVADRAVAYRFMGDFWATSETATRWTTREWASGAHLDWNIARDPDWNVFFDSREGVAPFVEQSLQAWSRIPTADISWGLGRLEAPAEVGQDGINSLFIDDEQDAFGSARIWMARTGTRGAWEISECDVALGKAWATNPEDWNAPDWFRATFRDDETVRTLTHEFGHCLGLNHSGALSLAPNVVEQGHPGDPAMSYGVGLPLPDDLSRDDIVAASLLRPGTDREGQTGSISGTLSMASKPVEYAVVWALPRGDQPLHDRVGAFSDSAGEFVIEGLDPGEYALMAQPMMIEEAHPLAWSFSTRTGLEDVVRGGLVRVTAGRSTRGITLTMRSGRETGVPLDGGTGERAAPISGAWVSACRGVWVRAERPRRHPRFIEPRLFTTTLTVEWPHSGSAVFDWVAPYVAYRSDLARPKGAFAAALDIMVSSLRFERTESTVRKVMEIAWPEAAAPSLRFRSEDTTCDGEPLIVCDFAGCELRGGGGLIRSRPPRAVGRIADQVLTDGGGAMTIPVFGTFSDPDGDLLHYDASPNESGVVGTSVFSSSVRITPVRPGNVTVTVTATDPGGLYTTQSFGVTVESGATGNGLCQDSRATPRGSSAALVRECEILLNAADELRGSGSLNWSSDLDIGSWAGVESSRDGVTGLNLVDIQLTGSIPDWLGSLATTEFLWLGHNELTGAIPESLGNLISLESLALQDNRFMGTIPDSLAKLTNLEVLRLSSNELTGTIPDSLAKLMNLEVLSLSSNNLTGTIPDSLAKLTNLEVLSLWWNKLTGTVPDWLGKLTNLEALNLSHNELTGPVPDSLGNLTNLEVLNLSSNELTGPVPDSLGNLTNLEALILSSNELTGPVPDWLGSLTSIEWLELGGNDLTGTIPDSLGNLTNLSLLNLEFNNLTGTIPGSLAELTTLQYLYLWHNRLTGCVPAGLEELESPIWAVNTQQNGVRLKLCRD